jgi:hypothetical protein
VRLEPQIRHLVTFWGDKFTIRLLQQFGS